MIIGTLEIGQNTLHTSNKSYVLSNLRAISAGRPLLPSALLFASAVALFGFGFADILYEDEKRALSIGTGVALILGLCVGRLKLVSRDLLGTPISDAVWGTYWHLNRVRPLIADAVDRAKVQERAPTGAPR